MFASNLYETSVFGGNVSSMSVPSAWAIVGNEVGLFRKVVFRLSIFDFVDADPATAIVDFDFHQSSFKPSRNGQ